jgi:UBX domain-containing protein 1
MIHGFGDLDGDKDGKKDGNKKKTESYIGGEKSGLAVENPNDPDINDILAKAQANSTANPGDNEDTQCTITLWAGGFQVNGEEYRPFEDQQNRQFMDDLKNERVPKELMNKFPGGMNLKVEDKHTEAYVEPPPPAFSGASTTLGGPSQQQTMAFNKDAPKIVPDPSKPTSNLAITYHNGEKETMKVNQDM